jgi:Flp pilus assembly pilin Flp
MWTARGEDGQAAVELVALLPALVAIAMLCWQALVAGEAWWLAGAAARDAARAEALGADPRAAARAALPGGLRSGLRVTAADPGVRVRVRIPSVFAGLRIGSVTARASMEPQS